MLSRDTSKELPLLAVEDYQVDDTNISDNVKATARNSLAKKHGILIAIHSILLVLNIIFFLTWASKLLKSPNSDCIIDPFKQPFC